MNVGSISWFVSDEEIKEEIECNHDYFVSVMLNVHRATDLAFSGEHELQMARSFSRNVLENFISMGAGLDDDQFSFRRLVTNSHFSIVGAINLF